MLLGGKMEVAGRDRVLDQPVLLGPIAVRLDQKVRPPRRPKGRSVTASVLVRGGRHGGTSIVIFARMPGKSCRSGLENSAQTRSWALTGSISGSTKTILPGEFDFTALGQFHGQSHLAPLGDFAEVLGLDIAFRPQAVDAAGCGAPYRPA